MRNARKIVFYFFIVFFFMVGVFHDQLLSVLLKKIFNDNSKGKIELNFDSFHIGLYYGSVSIKRPVVYFKDFYVGEGKNIMIHKIEFEEIKIVGLDVIDLIFKREINAANFYIDKPEFWLVEHGTSKKKELQPQGFVKALKQNSDIFSGIKLKIDDVEIYYGSVKLAMYALPDIDPGQVDFTINLKNFNTQHDTLNSDRVLLADEFSFKLRNLYKILTSGYRLSIDSLNFSSNSQDVIINGISFLPTSQRKEKNNIGFVSKKVGFYNILTNDWKDLSNVRMTSLIISDGAFINYINENKVLKTDSSSAKTLEKIRKIIHSIVADTVSVSSFNYYNIRNRQDTMISVNDIGFQVTDVELDSTMYSDIVKEIGFENISVSTGTAKVKNANKDISVSYDNLSYANYDREFTISGLNIVSENAGEESDIIDVSIPEVKIDGLYAHKLQKLKKQFISVFINDPDGDISFIEKSGEGEDAGSKDLILPDVYFYRIVINNGNINVSAKGKFKSHFKGLNVSVSGLKLPASKKDTLLLESVKVSSDAFNTFIEKENLNVKIGGIDYKHGDLSFSDVNLQQNDQDEQRSVKLRLFSVYGLDRQGLMYDNKLSFDSALISGPVIEGNFTIGKNNNDQGSNAFDSLLFPMDISFNTFRLKGGTINSTLTLNDEPVKINAGYNLSFDSFNVSEGDMVKPLLKDLIWHLNLERLKVNAHNYDLNAVYLLAETYPLDLKIDNLTISSETEQMPDSVDFYIRSLNLSYFGLNGFDYNLLSEKDSLRFNTLMLDNPELDIVVYTKEKADDETVQDSVDVSRYLKFKYESLVLNNMMLNVEILGNNKNDRFNLKGFSFEHFNDITDNDNLLNDLLFNVDEVNYENLLSGQVFRLNKCYIDRDKKSFYIDSIGSYKIKDGGIVKNTNGLDFYSDGIELSGIMIDKYLPARFTAHMLKVKNVKFDVGIEEAKKDNSAKMNMNIKFLKKFENILSFIRIDTAFLQDVNFNINTLSVIGSTSMKFDSISLMINKIMIDTALIDRSHFDVIDNITVNLNGKTVISGNGLYEMHPGTWNYDFFERKITIDSIYVTPLFEPEEFFRRAMYQTDRVDFFIPKIEFKDIDIDELIRENSFHVSHIDLYKIRGDMYRDKHYPIKPGTYKKLPREMIMGIKNIITVDTIFLHDSYLKYREMSEKADEPGEVFFDGLNVKAYNFTNKLQEGEEKDLILDAEGMIMGAAGFNINIHFPLNNDSIAFRMKGKTNKLDITQLNPITTNLLGLGVTKGTGSVDIKYIEATDSMAAGKLIFRYKKLRFHPYSRKKEKLKKGPITPLIKFMLNDLVVKSNNPRFARKPRVGQVYFERDTQKGPVNYIWKSVLSGLMSTMGFNNKEQRQEKKDKTGP